METSDWLLLILTFISGAFIGMLVYVTSFKPVYVNENPVGEEAVAGEFSVIGRSYGEGLATTVSPTFRLLGDGSYTYLPNSTSEPVEGQVPGQLLKDLQSLSTEDRLLTHRESATKSDCQSEKDGLDFEYRVVIENTSYALDTCRTNLDYEDDLALVLAALWQYMDEPTRGYQTPIQRREQSSLSDRLSDWLRQQLDPNYPD